jgi:hypothetical protein
MKTTIALVVGALALFGIAYTGSGLYVKHAVVKRHGIGVWEGWKL